MQKLWSEDARFRTWMRVELAAMKSMEKNGVLPRGSASALERKVKKISPQRIAELEAATRHDVIAFLAHIEEMAGEESRFMHFGMTSSDVLDTALAIQLAEAARLIIDELKQLLEVLKRQAMRHRATPLVGRTHGVHAQPVSLGLVFALWYAEMARSMERLAAARRGIAVGKLSGAVGTYQHLSPAVEEDAMKLLGLEPEPVSSQIVQRDRHAAYFTAIALCGASIEKMALTVRHWQRTEVAEAFEPFGKGQKGSSAMPHKRNPIISENLCGLARLLRANALAAMENVALWHERDISHSSVERVIGPDSTTLLHYMLRRLRGLISELEIDVKRMRENLEMTGGLIFSETVLNHLIRSGMRRQEAYALVQRSALKSLAQKKRFRDMLVRDRDITRRIGKDAIAASFDLERSLSHVDTIFRRVFGHGKK